MTATREITATVKGGKGYEASWMAFRGLADEVRNDIIESFGLTASDFDGHSIWSVVKAAESVAQGNGPLTVVKALSGSIVKTEKTETAAPSSATAPAAPKVDEAQKKLLEAIEKAGTVDELRELMKANKSAITDPTVRAAIKDRNTALKG